MGSVIEQLRARFADGVAAATRYAARDGLESIEVPARTIADVMRFLRDECAPRFEQLSSLTATDEKPQEPRFRVVYHVYSYAANQRVRIVARVPEEPAELASVTAVYPGADWQEREVFDMFGIVFTGHPDLKRILMPDGYGHHPLRKEFPLRGIEPERLYREWDASRHA